MFNDIPAGVLSAKYFATSEAIAFQVFVSAELEAVAVLIAKPVRPSAVTEFQVPVAELVTVNVRSVGTEATTAFERLCR